MEGEIISIHGSDEDKELFQKLEKDLISNNKLPIAPRKRKPKPKHDNKELNAEEHHFNDIPYNHTSINDDIAIKTSKNIEKKIEPHLPTVEPKVRPIISEKIPEIQQKKTVRIEVDDNQQIVTTNDELSRKKTEAVRYMIKSLENANSTGKFTLEESYNIWSQIILLNKQATTEEEMINKNNALTFIFKALKIGNKRGCFELEESFNIKLACDLFI